MFTNSSKLIKNQRFKAAIYAKVGVGKTQFALQFPGVAALDWERGMEPYVGKYDFDVDFVSTVEETEKAVRELAKDPQHYKTLVIDPISKLCAAYAERRRQLKITETGDKNYELDIRTDYGPIKRDIANFITMLLKLDMNIIVTARQKDLYAKGAFMVINGAAPDYHQILSELFDTVIYVEVDPEDSKRWAYTDAGAYDGVISNGTITAKDRYDLPGKFEFSYENVIKYLSQDALTKDASTVDLEAPEETVTSNRNTEVEVNGETLKTAGITAEQIQEIQEKVGKTTKRQEQFLEYLKKSYAVGSVLDLQKDEAEMVIDSLK